MRHRYTDKFLKLYLNIRNIFCAERDIQEDGVEYKQINDYEDPESFISWNEELLNIYSLEVLIKEFFNTEIEEEIDD
jgi:hypothetical protein